MPAEAVDVRLDQAGPPADGPGAPLPTCGITDETIAFPFALTILGVHIEFWSALTILGVPIFVAMRGGAEFTRPTDWPHVTADGNAERLANFVPGDAACAVTGGILDVVDVDPRNGGDPDAVRAKLNGLGVRIFAEIETPGGGRHFYVAGHPDIASGHDLPGWPGVDIQAAGRNVFLPGTNRPKYDGRGYRIVHEDLAALADGGDPDGAEALAGALAEANAARFESAGPAVEVAPPWDGKPLSARGTGYLDSALSKAAGRVAAATTGGRNNTLNSEIHALAKYTAGTGYPTAEMITEAMVGACTTNGLIAKDGIGSVMGTIRSGMRSGMTEPRAVVLPARSGIQGRVDAADAALRANGRANGNHGYQAVPVSPMGDTPPKVPPPPAARLKVITADTVVRRRVAYLWTQRVPVGAVTVMPGEEGIGKSTVGARIMAGVTRGTLDGEFSGHPRDVIVLAAEDGIEDVFVPRLTEAGADLSRVHIIPGRLSATEDTENVEDVIIPRDLPLLTPLVTEKSAALVWIDSLVTTLPDDMKSIAYKDTAKVLRAIGQWAETNRVAVVAPWHLNKATGSDAAVRMMDSRAFRTAVRSVLLVVADPDAKEGKTQGIVALDKANAGTLAVPALRYRIRSASYVVAEEDPVTNEIRHVSTSCGVADWIGPVEGDGRAIARAALTPAIDRADGSREWLRGYLSGREAERGAVITAGKEAGHSRAAIDRAAAALKIHSREETGREPVSGRPFRRALWSLPTPAAQCSQQSSPTPTGENTENTREGSDEKTEDVSAGQSQCSQSSQSSMGGQLALIGENTGAPRYCRVCGGRILLDDGREICARTDDAHKPVRAAIERVEFIREQLQAHQDLVAAAKACGDDASEFEDALTDLALRTYSLPDQDKQDRRK